jgi:hypothetical protein
MSGTADSSTVIQLVPRRTAEPNGVADYALALAGALRTLGIKSVFLSGTPAAEVAPLQDEWNTILVPKRQAHSLANMLHSLLTKTKASAVLLHFSGYGYQKRGVPLWLVQGLRNWSRRAGGISLLTVFHELYATGRPWQSSFWLSPAQILIARSILDLSSEVITPTEIFRNRLLEWSRGSQIRCMPVFSNVGEAGCGSQPAARAAKAVVFGLGGVENRLFGPYRQRVERIVEMMEIEEIIDIGPRLLSPPTSLAKAPVISKGALPRDRVSDVLAQARFGFVAYPFDVLGKSGVFAAYAANGVIPVVFADRRRSYDGLEAGRHFLDALRLETNLDADQLAGIQRRLFDWYESHSLPVQASFIVQAIERRRRLNGGYVRY